MMSRFTNRESLMQGSFLALGSLEEDEDKMSKSWVEQLFPMSRLSGREVSCRWESLKMAR